MEKILILGAKGMLGGQLMKVFGGNALGWDHQDVDVTDYANLKSKISSLNPRPKAVINCVAYNDVDGAEKNLDLAYKLNAEVPGELAKICNEFKVTLVHFSTNYVFDGEKGSYTESDKPNPLSVYGDSKYQGELAVQKLTANYYLIRTSVLFGPKGQSELSKKSFVELMFNLSQETTTIQAVQDEINSLTYVVDLAAQIKLLLSQGLPFGVYHIVNSGSASWYEYAREIFKIGNRRIDLVPILADDFRRPAKRPKSSVLINTKLPRLRSWQEALKEFLVGSL